MQRVLSLPASPSPSYTLDHSMHDACALNRLAASLLQQRVARQSACMEGSCPLLRPVAVCKTARAAGEQELLSSSRQHHVLEGMLSPPRARLLSAASLLL